MARLNDTQREVLGSSWNDIIWAVSHGYTTTDTVSAFANVARDLGGGLSFAESGAIATLYGYANRMQHAADAFQAASLEDQIMPEHIGVPPWARDEQVMNTAPIWHATFLYEAVDADGNVISEYRTTVFEMTLPDTVGELADDIQSDAEAMAAKYGHTLTNVTPIELLAV